MDDLEFGRCLAIAMGRHYAVFFAVVAVAVTALALRVGVQFAFGDTSKHLSLGNVATNAVLVSASWMVVAYLSRFRLLIGERGFRYVRPLRLVNAPIAQSWCNVRRVDPVFRPGLQALHIVISLRDYEVAADPSIDITSMFAASGEEIAALMNERLAEWRGATWGTSAVPDEPRPRRGRRHAAR